MVKWSFEFVSSGFLYFIVVNLQTIGSKDGVASAPDYFRLDHLQEEFNFATDKDIADNLRFQMIELRQSDTIPEFKNYHMIPLKEKEIPKELFDTYDRRKRREQETSQIDDHRLRVSKFLSQVCMDTFILIGIDVNITARLNMQLWLTM